MIVLGIHWVGNLLRWTSPQLGCSVQACSPCTCPASRLKKEPGDRNNDLSGLMNRRSYTSEAKSWINIPLYAHRAGRTWQQGRWETPDTKPSASSWVAQQQALHGSHLVISHWEGLWDFWGGQGPGLFPRYPGSQTWSTNCYFKEVISTPAG